MREAPIIIGIENLSFAYPDGQVALRDITLHIQAGEKVALIGPNGAGKSTLLLHLNGLLRPQSGQLRVCGLEVTPPHFSHIRQQVGMVFQNPDDQLFCPTVFEDVAFGPLYQGLSQQQVSERVITALEQVGMRDKAHRASYHLSLGEKKRVAIATVLAMQPALLVLDEPSAGLDPRARCALITLLKHLHPTLLIATHDLDLVKEVCERVVLLDEGHIVADGPAESILRALPLMKAYAPC